MIKAYTMLTKPGILLGNVVTTAAGFFLASRGQFDAALFCAVIAGLGLIIASACVFNNYIDRSADAKMARTKNRALVKGTISPKSALVFGLVLGALGVAVLGYYTNLLATLIAALGFFFYVVMYSICKYRSTHGTLVGSIAGAVPPVVGYTAVSHSLDLGAGLLFAILVLWQMPHFYAIATYRLPEYAAASIPVLPVTRGIPATKVQILLYTIAFLIAALLLPFYGYTGSAYSMVAISLGLAWLGLCLQGFRTQNDARWARRMFRFSLVVILGLSILMAVDTNKIYS